MPANPLAPQYPFDPTGLAASNKITGEQQPLTAPVFENFHFLIPIAAPFFGNTTQNPNAFSCSIKMQNGTVKQLAEGVDYFYTYQFRDASISIGQPIYGAICFIDLTLVGIVTFNYQTLGGDWTTDAANISTILANDVHNPFTTTWDQVINIPYSFPVINHSFNITDFVGMSDVVTAINGIVTAIQGQAVDQSQLIDAINTSKAALAAATGAQAQAQSAISIAAALDPAVAEQALNDLEATLATLEGGVPVQLAQQITAAQNAANQALAAVQALQASGGGGGGGTGATEDYTYFMGQI